MNTVDQIDSLTRATRRREFEDGLVDLLYGGVFLILGLASWFVYSTVGLRWLATVLIRYREIASIGLLVFVPALVLVIFAARRLIERWRRAYLWKGRGYVQSLRWQVKPAVSAAAAVSCLGLIGGVAWLTAVGTLNQDHLLRSLTSGVSLGTAIVYFGMGVDLRIRRYLVVGIAGAVLSLPLLLLAISFSQSWLLLGGGWMLILGIPGVWALRRSVSAIAEPVDG